MVNKQHQSPETLASDGASPSGGNARFTGNNGKNAKDKRREPKRPRRVTRDYLMNYATWYLERFAASRARLEKLMRGKIRLSVAEYGTDPEEAVQWMNSVLSACEKAGFINDDAYARGRARSLLRKGKAMRVIAADLSARGIASDQIDDAIRDLRAEADQAAYEEVRGTDPNIAAAAAYARRRRLGPWRRPDIREEKREKDMAALARQGFGYDTATRIINSDLDELNDLLSMIDGI
ncbi:regulatory protein RecX [Thalassospira povalilytica]|uniref:Regulatory protein RecX n=1 Tax=Thalassospira povalilytica TaxID=732237 RepID=A0A8I1SHV0_9PROT|nr:regulatory protein RecX [Thalassospira povalilytica]MBN8195010.1 regulatory protein RecX [Thalassospira povalilytica]HAY50365.1 RecX family transcriptional regulator [Thalassospira sp.]|eukprot:TRINITY_DN2902_c0_g11_i1.p1 TRINITY_DN2902_c0_g11~~TRINITY_DN2902_c0_g11_i1.p1  ORF type:complete len:236 (-),score=62.13 TRINITY_DN2902_c0_g11_i1:1617-2324(-)